MRPVVLVFLAINTVVFVSWLVLGASPFMLDNFLVSWDALAAGRTWTLLTSEFSHVWFLHFFVNMLVLWSFGPILEYTIGSARFFSFYVAAAVVASLGHAVVSAFILNQPGLPALGASGAISGLVVLFALIYPRARLLLLGIIPMPALVGVLAFVGLDLVGLIAQAYGGGLPIGHGAHLGGALTGALYYAAVIRPLQMRQAQRISFGDAATWRRLIEQQRDREDRKP